MLRRRGPFEEDEEDAPEPVPHPSDRSEEAEAWRDRNYGEDREDGFATMTDEGVIY